MKISEAIKGVILKPKPIKRIVSYYFHCITDCYVVSYPKCGRTWLRMMLAKAIALHFKDPREIVFDPMDVVRTGGYKGPLIRFIHDGSDRPPVVDNSGLRNRYKRFTDKKIILLIRDPRDVVVSSYFQHTRRGGVHCHIADFVRDPWWGVDRIVVFMKEWYEHRAVPGDFLLVRYEDLYKDGVTTLLKVVDFIGLPKVSDEVVRKSVDYASFENMRSLSLSELKNEPRLAPKYPQDPESFKVRRGEVGGYISYLARDDLAYIEKRIRSTLPAYFGYSHSRGRYWQ